MPTTHDPRLGLLPWLLLLPVRTSRSLSSMSPPRGTLGVLVLLGLYKILFYFEALLHNNIFCKHPLFIVQYIAQYYQLLHPPARF